MGFPNISDFSPEIGSSAESLYRNWDSAGELPPSREDLVEFLEAMTSDGERWLTASGVIDVGLQPRG